VSRIGLAVATAASVMALLSGCGGATNDGGDTTCKDFVAMRTDDKDATVANMLKERNGRNSSTTDVINTRIKLVDVCRAADKTDAKIGDLG
jgi:acid stress chaperone HdeA